MSNVVNGEKVKFWFVCFTSPLPLLDEDLAASTTARAAEHYPNSTLHNTGRAAAADSIVWLTSSCQPIVGNPLVCVSMPYPSGRDCIWTRAKVASGRASRACLSFLFPWCPIKFCYTAQMLHGRVGFQEIITDWEGQHPVAVGEPLCVCVCAWLPKLFMCLSVLEGTNMAKHEARMWGHTTVTGHKSTLWCHGNVTKPL